MILILPITQIFDKMYAFIWIFAYSLCILSVIVNTSQVSRAR